MESYWSLVGLIPALVALRLVQSLDARRPEPVRMMGLAVLLGALAVVVVLVLWEIAGETDVILRGQITSWEGIFSISFLGAAIPEELAKGLALFIVARSSAFDERADGIVYGALIGITFGALENVAYLYTAPDWSAFLNLFMVRSIMSMPLHGLLVAMVGFGLARRRFDGKGSGALNLLLMAILLHGLFDVLALASVQERSFNIVVGGFPVFIMGCALIVAAAWAAVRFMLVAALKADEIQEMKTGSPTKNARISAQDGERRASSLFEENALMLVGLPLTFVVFFWVALGDFLFALLAAVLGLVMVSGLSVVWAPPRSLESDLAGVIPCPACDSNQTFPHINPLKDGSDERVMRCVACNTEFGGALGPETTRSFTPEPERQLGTKRRRRRR